MKDDKPTLRISTPNDTRARIEELLERLSVIGSTPEELQQLAMLEHVAAQRSIQESQEKYRILLDKQMELVVSLDKVLREGGQVDIEILGGAASTGNLPVRLKVSDSVSGATDSVKL